MALELTPAQQQRYQLVNALTKNAFSGPTPTPVNLAAKLAQALVAKRSLDKLDQEQIQRRQNYQSTLADAIRATGGNYSDFSSRLGPTNLGPQQRLAAILAQNPDTAPMGAKVALEQAMKGEEKFTLGPNETLFGGGGRVIARGASSPNEPEVKSQFGAVDKEGNRFTVLRTNRGLFRQQLDEQGKVKLVPVDSRNIRPIRTQEQGTSEDLGLTSSQRGKSLEREARSRGGIESLIRAFDDLERAPGAAGIRGLAVDKLGGLIGQIPGFGETAEKSFSEAISDASPEEVQRFRTRARTVVASMLSEVTGEESGRFTETERAIAEQALKQLDPTASYSQIKSALTVAFELALNAEDRERQIQGKQPRFDMTTREGRADLGEFLQSIGFSDEAAVEFVVSRAKAKRLLE